MTQSENLKPLLHSHQIRSVGFPAQGYPEEGILKCVQVGKQKLLLKHDPEIPAIDRERVHSAPPEEDLTADLFKT